MIKKTLLAVAMSATFISLGASANNNTRANGSDVATTLPSVGYRPIAAPKDGKDLQITGKLITGETLTIDKIFITDADGDGNDSDVAGEASLAKTDVTWVLVKADSSEVTLTHSAGNNKVLIIPAEAAGGKIKVVYTVKTKSGTPDTADAETSIILKPDNSGVTDGSTDGTISAKLTGVTINVIYAASGYGAAPTDALNGTNVQNTPVTGSTLEAALTCAVASDCADAETKYDFQWQMADAGTTSFTDITGAQDMTYKITGTQQNKLFKVVVTPKTTKAGDPVTKAKRR